MSDELIEGLRLAASYLPEDYIEVVVLLEKAADTLEQKELVIKGYRSLALNILGVKNDL